MSSFFFSNNFSTLSNVKIVGMSKLEAFAEEFKLRHELFSAMFCSVPEDSSADFSEHPEIQYPR